MRYIAQKNGVLKIVGDSQTSIPNDEKNKDWIEYLDWVKSGNSAETQEEKFISYTDKRRTLYNQRGATIENLVIAMFEKDAAEIERLQAIRQQVKQEIRK